MGARAPVTPVSPSMSITLESRWAYDTSSLGTVSVLLKSCSCDVKLWWRSTSCARGLTTSPFTTTSHRRSATSAENSCGVSSVKVSSATVSSYFTLALSFRGLLSYTSFMNKRFTMMFFVFHAPSLSGDMVECPHRGWINFHTPSVLALIYKRGL